MNPLELEIYHQIKNVIGVNPTFYEYLFMVDADTTVDPFSLNRLISAYVFSDAKVHNRRLMSLLQDDPRQETNRRLWRNVVGECETILDHHDASLRVLYLTSHGQGV